MIEYILSLTIILTVTILYICVVQPRRLYNRYVRDLKELGYKVYERPFEAFRIPFLKDLTKGTQQGDTLKFWRTVCPTTDVIVGNSLNQITLDVSHLDFLRELHSNQHLYTYPKDKMITRAIIRAMGRGILLSEGDEWKRKRRIINGVFNFDFIKSMTGKITELCSRAIQDTEAESVKNYDNGEEIVEYQVIDLTIRMFSSVVLECFLGGVIEEKIQGKPVFMLMTEIMNDTLSQTFRLSSIVFGSKYLDLGVTAFDRQVNRKLKMFREWGLAYVKSKVQQTKQKIKTSGISGPPADIIEALVRAQLNSEENKENSYSNQEIFEEFSTFFVAGTDTTAHFVMMMIYYIVQNPSIEEKVRKQIENFMSDDNYSYENLKNLTYIESVQKQTTRLYGPLTGLLSRVAKQDNILNGLKVKKGTLILFHYSGNHLSEKYFSDPLTFRPERWQKQCNNLPHFVFNGFGGGARTCIGKHLANIVSKISLIKFMKRYKKVKIPEGPIKMVLKFLYSPEYFTSKMTINK